MGLEHDGQFRATCALTADDALAAVLRDRPEAAIIDAVLPKVSGLALARTVMDMNIPVLITTGEPEHQRRMTEANYPFIAKPFSISRLLIATRLLLGETTRRMEDLAASFDRMVHARRELAHVVQDSRHLADKACDLVWRSRCEHAASGQGALRNWAARAALFNDIVDEAIAATGADMGNLQLVDPATGTLGIAASRGFGPPFLTFFAAVQSTDDSACGAALKQANRIIVPDVARSEIFMGHQSGEVLGEAGVLAVQSTPMFGRTGHLIGMISTHRASVWLPSDRDLARVDALVHPAAAEIEAG